VIYVAEQNQMFIAGIVDVRNGDGFNTMTIVKVVMSLNKMYVNNVGKVIKVLCKIRSSRSQPNETKRNLDGREGGEG